MRSKLFSIRPATNGARLYVNGACVGLGPSVDRVTTDTVRWMGPFCGATIKTTLPDK